MNIYEQVNQKGIEIFINPQSLHSYERLVFGADIKGKKMTVLASNTYRGFHRVDKSKSGPKYYFEKCLTDYKDIIINRLLNTPSEKEIDDLENEIRNHLKGLLKNNIGKAGGPDHLSPVYLDHL